MPRRDPASRARRKCARGATRRRSRAREPEYGASRAPRSPERRAAFSFRVRKEALQRGLGLRPLAERGRRGAGVRGGRPPGGVEVSEVGLEKREAEARFREVGVVRPADDEPLPRLRTPTGAVPETARTR